MMIFVTVFNEFCVPMFSNNLHSDLINIIYEYYADFNDDADVVDILWKTKLQNICRKYHHLGNLPDELSISFLNKFSLVFDDIQRIQHYEYLCQYIKETDCEWERWETRKKIHDNYRDLEGISCNDYQYSQLKDLQILYCKAMEEII